MRRKKKKTIYEKYRMILRKPHISNDEIDIMRKNIRLIALSLVEHVLKTKVDQIY
jgi:hypothetical protein